MIVAEAARSGTQTRKPALEPAASLLRQIGSNTYIARQLGLSRVQVWRWTQPSEVGGTGGRIPSWHRDSVTKLCREHGVLLDLGVFIGAK